jgi:peptidoglycan hydrolase-like protein with peptidoglycan-binding domain
MRDNFIVKPGGLLLLGASALIWSSSVLAADYEGGTKGTATSGQEQRAETMTQQQRAGGEQQREEMAQQYNQERGQLGQTGQAGEQFARGEQKGQQMSSNQIRQLQQELRSEGYQVAVDGIWGPETQQALRDYQMDENLEVSGEPDQRTMASLGLDIDAAAMGRFGEQERQVQLSSSQIRNLQQELNQEGHKIAVDGMFGPETQRALTEYQRDENLPVTGRPDQQTLTSLGVETTNAQRETPRAGLGMEGLQREEVGDREGRFGDVPESEQRGAEERGQFGAAERGETTALDEEYYGAMDEEHYGMGE